MNRERSRPRRMPYRLLVDSVRETSGHGPGENGWDVAMVLLSSANVGPNIEKVAAHTRLPKKRVGEIGRACREQGVWKGAAPKLAFLDDPEHAAAAFALDSLAVRGFLTREGAKPGTPKAVG